MTQSHLRMSLSYRLSLQGRRTISDEFSLRVQERSYIYPYGIGIYAEYAS